MKKLSAGQIAVLTAAFLPMLATGVIGGIGTYSNIGGAYGRGTALGALSAGEGATAVLALVLLGLTMLGQSSPRVVRLGLWLLPAAAAVMGAVAAPDAGRTVLYALTPMGMSISAEGMAFVARRIVVYRTEVDIEAQRRNAATLRQIAYHRARAERHPWKWVRKRSTLKVWRLLGQAGDGDAQLGHELVTVQRDQLTEGAGIALGELLGTDQRDTPALPAVTPSQPATPEAERTSHRPCNTLDEHAAGAIDLVADATLCDTSETDVTRPGPTRTVAAAQQPATVVHQRITPDLEAAIEDALRTVADDETVRLLTVAEVAKQKGVTAGTVRSWVNRGKLTPAQRDSDGRLRFHPNDVAELD